ncbi:MAG TPA: DsbA family protein [Caulobacteraceae bacterium]
MGIAFAIPAVADAAAPVKSVATAEEGMALGNPKARVTVIEYASLSCPHCANWANEVFPAFKAKYVDTGRVRFVLREFLTPPAEMAAAGWLLARCAGPAKYFSVVDAIFKAQDKILAADSMRDGLLAVASAAGMGEGSFDQCITDKKALEDLNARVQLYVSRDKITGTPTFMVGERRLDGEQSLEALGAAIAAAHR